MRVYGLDFASNPSASKRLTLAHCHVDRDKLMVLELEELSTSTVGDFSRFCDWLAGNGNHPKKWIAGIDFPFGMPVEVVERFGWLGSCDEQSWASYVERLHRETDDDLDAFQRLIESWKKSGKTGNDKRVHLLRHADKLSGFAGSSPSSPMKVHYQCNPSVGRMFFRGAEGSYFMRIRRRITSPRSQQRGDDTHWNRRET